MSNLETKKLQLAEKWINEKKELSDLKEVMGVDFLKDQLHTEEGFFAGLGDKIKDKLLLQKGGEVATSILPQLGILSAEQITSGQKIIAEYKEKLKNLSESRVDQELKNKQATEHVPDDEEDETNKTPQPETQTPSSSIEASPHIDSIYENLIGPKPSKESFSAAYTGYSRIIKEHDIPNKQYLTIVDYTKGRSDKRLYVIDLENNKTLFHEQSGHGKNSGGEMAHAFSNHASSNKSSLGFMKVGNKFEKNSKETREGLRLYGLEDGINDQTDERGIFIHPASVTGSLGCITLPKNAEKIMKTIQGGIIFSYDDDSDYLTSSPYLNDPTTQVA